MSLTAIEESWKNVRRGDSHIRNLPFYQVDENGQTVAIDLAAAFPAIKLQVRKGDITTPIIQDLSLANGQITISDTNLLSWSIDTSNLLGKYFYELQMEYSDGTIETWIHGDLTVINDVTN